MNPFQIFFGRRGPTQPRIQIPVALPTEARLPGPEQAPPSGATSVPVHRPAGIAAARRARLDGQSPILASPVDYVPTPPSGAGSNPPSGAGPSSSSGAGPGSSSGAGLNSAPGAGLNSAPGAGLNSAPGASGPLEIQAPETLPAQKVTVDVGTQVGGAEALRSFRIPDSTPDPEDFTFPLKDVQFSVGRSFKGQHITSNNNTLKLTPFFSIGKDANNKFFFHVDVRANAIVGTNGYCPDIPEGKGDHTAYGVQVHKTKLHLESGQTGGVEYTRIEGTQEILPGCELGAGSYAPGQVSLTNLGPVNPFGSEAQKFFTGSVERRDSFGYAGIEGGLAERVTIDCNPWQAQTQAPGTLSSRGENFKALAETKKALGLVETQYRNLDKKITTLQTTTQGVQKTTQGLEKTTQSLEKLTQDVKKTTVDTKTSVKHLDEQLKECCAHGCESHSDHTPQDQVDSPQADIVKTAFQAFQAYLLREGLRALLIGMAVAILSVTIDVAIENTKNERVRQFLILIRWFLRGTYPMAYACYVIMALSFLGKICFSGLSVPKFPLFATLGKSLGRGTEQALIFFPFSPLAPEKAQQSDKIIGFVFMGLGAYTMLRYIKTRPGNPWFTGLIILGHLVTSHILSPFYRKWVHKTASDTTALRG